MGKKKFAFQSLIPVGISMITFASFVGSVSGSIAWWAYSTRASVSYQGTSVTTSEQLQIGLKLDKSKFTSDEISDLEALGLEVDSTLSDANYEYAFVSVGANLNANVIKTYLQYEGVYAIDELSPITTREYHTGDSLTLYESLISGNQVNENIAATNKYVHIPFVFRILKFNSVSTDDKYAEDRDIYLSNVRAEASNETPGGKIQNAMRVYIDNGNAGEGFILNPSDTTTVNEADMKTRVGGLLNLTPDYVYDFDDDNNEIIYGDYTITGATSTFVPDSDPTTLVNINEIEDAPSLSDLDNATTFLAGHASGKNCYSNYDGITFKYSEYKTLNLIKPDSSKAKLTGGLPLCTTSDSSGHYLAELTITAWLEGWDHSVIDWALENGHKFNLDLQFQIDLVS